MTEDDADRSQTGDGSSPTYRRGVLLLVLGGVCILLAAFWLAVFRYGGPARHEPPGSPQDRASEPQREGVPVLGFDASLTIQYWNQRQRESRACSSAWWDAHHQQLLRYRARGDQSFVTKQVANLRALDEEFGGGGRRQRFLALLE